MNGPPFRQTPLASAFEAARHIENGAIAEGRLSEAPPPAVEPRRTRLSDLNSHLHCSLIGTCLGTRELRPLAARYKGVVDPDATDLDVHHAAVELAAEGGAGAKALHKLLDDRYAGAVRRFQSANGPDALLKLWSAAMDSGEVPGAYWAMMTHPCATLESRQVAFGDVHMLSHLVGAANRTDVRRLIALEREKVALTDKIGRQQAQLHRISLENRATVRELTKQVADLTSRLHPESPETAAELRAQVAQLQEDVRGRDRLAALHANRREELELLLAIRSEELRHLQVELSAAQALERSLKLELHALERQLDPVREDEPKLEPTGLAGLRVLYVGGRPRSNATIRGLCTRTGIDLSLHDGGIEDRKGLLAAAVPGVDLVLFPVDCVDHDSASRLKRLCQRYGVSFLPLRTAGAASFLAGVTEYVGRPVSVPAQSPSRFCLHHG